MKLLHGAIIRVRGLPTTGRTFRMRLFDLVFTVLSLVLAIGATLMVFNLRDDWMLLGASTILLLAAAWIALKMAPGAVEQVTMLLNLGAVQEGERVLFEGVPYRVDKLDFYSGLDNPELDGANITLPRSRAHRPALASFRAA